ncbi:MAG: DUF302 domain-containing protein [Bacteroidetes bacterium]|nr:DUF302 domain-containing protein [Bacteroidota bacterium]
MNHIKVLELCKPAYSGKLLAQDNERDISSLMPCRISVYEKSDGKTYVSRINSGLLSNFLGGLFAEVMGQASEDMEEIIQPVL